MAKLPVIYVGPIGLERLVLTRINTALFATLDPRERAVPFEHIGHCRECRSFRPDLPVPAGGTPGNVQCDGPIDVHVGVKPDGSGFCHEFEARGNPGE